MAVILFSRLYIFPNVMYSVKTWIKKQSYHYENKWTSEKQMNEHHKNMTIWIREQKGKISLETHTKSVLGTGATYFNMSTTFLIIFLK